MRVRSVLLTIIVLAFVPALAACGGDDAEEPAAADAAAPPTQAGENGGVVVELHEQNGSGQSGTMTLEPVGQDRTRVVLEVTEAEGSQPAHIHAGSCENLDPAPAYGLPNVVDGRSETTVDASVDELVRGDFAVNVHRSDDDLETYVACGDIGDDADEAAGSGRDY